MPVVRVRDIDMYYEVHGAGEPLVLIGGLGNDVSEWEWMVEWCSRTHRVLALDNRGAGRSGKPDAPYSIEMMAADTDALMDEVGFTHAIVVGVSMGGRIGLALALDHPERVAALILVSTSASIRADPGLTRADILSLFAGLYRGSYPQPRYARSRQRQASRDHDSTDRLQEIRVPTTIMHGRKDKIVPLREAELLRRGISNSQLITFRGGHLFFMLRERRWFLDSLDSALRADQSVRTP